MDLSTLARTKAYIGGNISTNADPVISALISRASDQAMQFTGRSFQRVTVNNMHLNGTGTDRLMLPYNPIISVSSVTVCDRALSLVTDADAVGYQYDEKFIYLCGGWEFPRGRRNVQVSFDSGFSTTQDAYIPKGANSLTPTSGSGIGPDGAPANTSGPAVVDRGVWNYDDNKWYTRVASNPAHDQYTFADGVYTFDNTDRDEQVRMEYDYVPGSVEQAGIEMVAALLKRRDNAGISSRSIGQENVVYETKMLVDAVKEMLQPYRFIILP